MTFEFTENQLKWFEALRSGKYKQTIGTLYRRLGDAYCCLGVADKMFCDRSDDYARIRNELNMHLEGQDICVRMNDDLKKPFPEIADYCEQHPEEIFRV